MGTTAVQPKWLRSYCSFVVVLSMVLVDAFGFLQHGVWRAPQVHAAVGDFSVFTETTGTEVIAGTGNDVTWDTPVVESANIDLQANTSDIDLVDAGKYLVLYNAWTEQGATGGNNRRSVASYLTVNGVASEYGWGGGYIRDAENDFTAYNSGGAILDVNAGDDLAVALDRDDSNPTGGTAIRDATNGVSVLKLDDDLDYVRVHASTDSTDISANTTFAAVNWDTADEVDTDSFTFVAPATGVTVSGAAEQKFIVTTNVKLQNTDTGGQRQNYELRLTLDGVEVPGTRSAAYIRFDNGDVNSTLQYTGIIQKTAASDQTLAVEVRREGEASDATIIVGDETALAMVALPADAQVLSLTNAANETLTSAPTTMALGNQVSTAPSFLSHSTTTANDDIVIDAPGDYVVFATTYTERTSGTGRDVPKIDWLIDGATQSYGGHGHYNRGDQAAEDTYTSGGSGGAIFPGLSAGQVLELAQSDETTGTPNSVFSTDRVAVQVVELGQLTNAVTTNVSQTGTQIATTSVSTTNLFAGEQLAVIESAAARNLTNVVLTESGSIDATAGLDNVRLVFDLDTTVPYDCVSETYSGTETEFGATGAFSGADGTLTFNDSVSISPTTAFCAYVVYDVTTQASDGETINFTIDDPSSDITVTGDGVVVPGSPLGALTSTVVQNAEVTQTGYHWRNDDGSETGATSATGGVENTPGLSFATTTPQRLRLGVAGLGTGAQTSQYRLEYGQKVTTCAAVVSWTDVSAGGGAWDMFDSIAIFEGADTTNIAVSTGGVSDGGTGFVTPNGGVRDVSAQTAPISLSAPEFVELEYAVQATASAVEGVAYCFRVTDAGTALRTYDHYPEATLNADVTVSSLGTQVATIARGTSDAHIGGVFVVTDNSGSRTVTDITITETGTIDASVDIDAVRLLYETDNTAPYDCVSESYDGTELQFGVDSTFAGDNGTSTFSDLVLIVSGASALCVYPVLDLGDSASDALTIDIRIGNPSSDVLVSSGSVGPGSEAAIAGTTLTQAPALTQANYHWRNDDGNETGATSATGGVENTAVTDVFQNSVRRLRLVVNNDGTLTEPDAELRLEYGTKVTTCANVGVWQRVDSGIAFALATDSGLSDGADTTNIAVATGGVSNPAATFVTPNAGQEETTDQIAGNNISTTEYLEVEYAVQVTDTSGFGATYCFRVTDAGEPLAIYGNYPELTVQDRQDFFVQRGTETVSGTGVTLTAGVDYTAPANASAAYVRITNTSMTGAGSDTLGQTRAPDDVFAYITAASDLTTGFTITRPPTATDNTRVSWEIVEYIGVAGGDNEFIVRAQDEVTYTATSLFATGTSPAGIVDDADIAVIITGQINPSAGTNNYNTGLSISSWNASTDEPVFERGDADSVAAGVSYAVVEFTGANWNIQRVEHTFAAAGVTETETITAVNSPARTFLHTQKLSGDELFNLDESGHEVWLSSIGAVSFVLQAGSTNPSEQRSVAWVIENTQLGVGALQVYRSNGTITQGGIQPITVLTPIGATITPTNASIWANMRSSGAGSAHPRAIIGARIVDETQVEFWKSDEGQNQAWRLEVVEWPVAETSIRQTHYRLYVDNDTLTPTDPWPAGAVDLGENTAMTDLDEPIGQGERLRVRTGLFVNNASLVAESASFKLQYARRVTTCSAIASWNDVGDPGDSAVWRGYDASPVDGSVLPSALLSTTDELATYEETSPSTANPSTVSIGEYVEYDWHIEHNGALQKSSYCLRMVYNDGQEIDGYDVYPTIRTTGYTPVMVNWRWFDDETNETPATALAAEVTAPIEIAASNTLKLRVAVTEIEGAPGEDIKFNLEYSPWSDFRDGGTLLTATTSCTEMNRTWCYADGAGADGATLDATTLTGVDACASGTGVGCGAHNEAAGLAGAYQQPVFTTSEHEFTLLHNSIGYDQVYYFRMVDATNGVSLLASSSYPSLTTAGAALTFSISGIDAGQTFEGVTTDATTTATDVAFGKLPFGTSVEVAQRLTVFTNGTEGYRVFMQADQQLENGSGQQLTPVTGTNAVPAPWGTGCTGVADSCFGYHSGDNILYDGSLRFALDDSYAALSTTPVEVMASGVPVTFDTSEIIYRTQVTSSQPAGEYTTTLRYIVVPVF